MKCKPWNRHFSPPKFQFQFTVCTSWFARPWETSLKNCKPRFPFWEKGFRQFRFPVPVRFLSLLAPLKGPQIAQDLSLSMLTCLDDRFSEWPLYLPFFGAPPLGVKIQGLSLVTAKETEPPPWNLPCFGTLLAQFCTLSNGVCTCVNKSGLKWLILSTKRALDYDTQPPPQSERAEYGFGEHGFKHRAQWVFWPSPGSPFRGGGGRKWVNSSQPILCAPMRTHQVFIRNHRVCCRTEWVLSSETKEHSQKSIPPVPYIMLSSGWQQRGAEFKGGAAVMTSWNRRNRQNRHGCLIVLYFAGQAKGG